MARSDLEYPKDLAFHTPKPRNPKVFTQETEEVKKHETINPKPWRKEPVSFVGFKPCEDHSSYGSKVNFVDTCGKHELATMG
ncbi:hypothetical protein COLO4_24454 [Corchorus olitorius]|uniref:Uncharacterized protein n=1 Tax=Corchorus olitorius TaxID=93759 RepID=A0A1R3IA44_9ROSI|nr:hypothetical protein COLO4_24454 [Corchorus olitorius]